MMHVVLDTNILVSALWSRDGNPIKIIHLMPSGKIIPCYCNEMLNEYSTVLSRPKFGFSQVQVATLLKNIQMYGRSYQVSRSIVPLPDESDRAFYDVAQASNAILITGNAKHFPAEPFIMTPAAFLAKITVFL